MYREIYIHIHTYIYTCIRTYTHDSAYMHTRSYRFDTNIYSITVLLYTVFHTHRNYTYNIYTLDKRLDKSIKKIQ